MTSKSCISFMRLVDSEKRIMKLKTPKAHLKILDILNSHHKYTLITASRGFAKTTLTSQIWLPNYIMDTFKDENILIFSSSTQKSQGFMEDTKAALQMIINAGFALKKNKWGKVIELINENGAKISLESKSVTQDIRGEKKDFLRPTLVICDDIESKAMSSQFNVKSNNGRAKLKDFFYSDLMPSLSEDGRIIVIGTILHKDSLLSNLMENPMWEKVIVPAMENNQSNWKSKFPLNKEEAREISTSDNKIISLEEIKEDWFKQGKHSEFYQEYLCSPIADEKKIFDPLFFKYFDGLLWGDNESMEISDALYKKTLLIKNPQKVITQEGEIGIEKFRICASMDLGSTGADESVIIVCGMYEHKLYVLEALGGHWSPFEKVCAVLEVMKTYKPYKFGIEKAGAQNDFFYTAKVASEQYKTPIPIVELSHGGKAKNIRIAALEPYFNTGKIIFNAKNSNINKLESELLDFDIDTEAKKDNYSDALAYQLQLFFGIGAKGAENKAYPKVYRGDMY